MEVFSPEKDALSSLQRFKLLQSDGTDSAQVKTELDVKNNGGVLAEEVTQVISIKLHILFPWRQSGTKLTTSPVWMFE